jgi:molecular chaperone DnaK (HSP70)
MHRGEVIEIDHGTTFSPVRYISGDDIELIEDDDSFSIPAVVAYQRCQWTFGKAARYQAVRFPETTIFATKRIQKCPFHMPFIRESKKC